MDMFCDHPRKKNFFIIYSIINVMAVFSGTASVSSSLHPSITSVCPKHPDLS